LRTKRHFVLSFPFSIFRSHVAALAWAIFLRLLRGPKTHLRHLAVCIAEARTLVRAYTQRSFPPNCHGIYTVEHVSTKIPEAACRRQRLCRVFHTLRVVQGCVTQGGGLCGLTLGYILASPSGTKDPPALANGQHSANCHGIYAVEPCPKTNLGGGLPPTCLCRVLRHAPAKY